MLFSLRLIIFFVLLGYDGQVDPRRTLQCGSIQGSLNQPCLLNLVQKMTRRLFLDVPIY